MKNPLLDKTFLKQLDEYHHKERYAKIVSLSFATEMPQQEIEGRVTTGTINVDGSSAVRRTCSLTLISDSTKADEKLWYENSKFKVYVGLKNEINSDYPDVIWFPMGIYIINSFNQTINSNSNSISISGKDKMCLLNGEVGGKITSLTWDFGTVDDVAEDGTITNTDIPIRQIILDLVHQFAQEKYENIIINDLDEAAVELLKYKGSSTSPLYLIIDKSAKEVKQITINGDLDFGGTPLNELTDTQLYSRFELAEIDNAYVATINGVDYVASKISSEEVAGYRETDLTYSGDLIASLGESATSVLDKIVTMLGNYEYYYNVDGQFIFQRKKTYISTSFNNLITTDGVTYAENNSDVSSISYNFSGDQLISSFTNTPTLNNLANDYTIWGSRTSSSGSTMTVHLRYAIDKKPDYYKGFNGTVYSTDSDLDWREIIYQMAIDYYKHNTEDDFYYNLELNNGTDADGTPRYPNGITGYEQYYPDMEGFWRQLYCPIGWFYTKTISEEDFKNNISYNELGYLYGPNYFYYNDDTGKKVLDTSESITEGREYYYKSYTYEYAGKGGNNGLNYISGKYYYYNEDTNKYEPDENESVTKGRQYYVQEVNYVKAGIGGTLDFNYKKDTYYYVNTKGEYEIDTNEKATTERQYYIRREYNEAGVGGIYPFEYEQSKYYYYKNDVAILDSSSYVTTDRVYYTRIDNYESVTLNQNYTWKSGYYYYVNSGNKVVDTNETVKLRKYYNGINTYYFLRIYDEVSQSYSYKSAESVYNAGKTYYIQNDGKTDYNEDGWVNYLTTEPELINFWFDFLDNDAEMSKYSVKLIGDRPKTTNDDDVKAIYFRETPTVIFTDNLSGNDRKYNYVYMQYQSAMESLFTISSQGKSAKDVLDEQLYNYGYCIESVQLSTIPIYYLEPNVRISINNNTSKINGEYIMTKFSLPLNYSGTMSITATKVPTRLY